MRKIFTIIVFLCSNIVFAQDYHAPIPTQFDAFINQPNIEWAAYANDSVRFDKINFNKLLVKRLERGQIRVTYPMFIISSRPSKLEYLNKKNLDDAVLTPCCVDYIYSPDGTKLDDEAPRKPLKVDTAIFSNTDIFQIIYIEKGILKSYIPWVSPLIIDVIISAGIRLGYSEYFSTCFNFKYNHQLTKQKVTFLSQTKRKIRLDSIEEGSKLKELYGRNMIETLWPYILKGKIKAFSINDTVQLNTKSINTSLLGELIPPVDIYDAAGNIGPTKVIEEPLSPKHFTEIELVQDWYYDYKQNMVFSKIKYANLYAKKWKKQVQDIESSPVLKIVF